MSERDQDCLAESENVRSELTPKQEAFIRALLACEGSVAEASEMIGVCARTGRRYMADPAVKAAIDDAHTDALKATAQALAGRCGEALDVLLGIMRDKTEAGNTRRMAAKSVLDLALACNEQVELSERMAELEAWRAELEERVGGI